MTKFKIPDVIYLQCHDEYGELMDWGDEITWCVDNDNELDVKYVRVINGDE